MELTAHIQFEKILKSLKGPSVCAFKEMYASTEWEEEETREELAEGALRVYTWTQGYLVFGPSGSAPFSIQSIFNHGPLSFSAITAILAVIRQELRYPVEILAHSRTALPFIEVAEKRGWVSFNRLQENVDGTRLHRLTIDFHQTPTRQIRAFMGAA